MDKKKYAPVPKVDYNEKLIRQQYEPMTPQEQYQLKMEALKTGWRILVTASRELAGPLFICV